MACNNPRLTEVRAARLEARAIVIYEWALSQGGYFLGKNIPDRDIVSVEQEALAMLLSRGLIGRSGQYRPVRYQLLRTVESPQCLEVIEGMTADHLKMRRLS